MTTPLRLKPRAEPCSTCPYRRDVPSGVWHEAEYEKLITYDSDTAYQPPGVFMCHAARDGCTMCRGWLDVHDKSQLLSLRLAALSGHIDPALFDLPHSPVPTFRSGQEAADHGMKDIEKPTPTAQRVITKLTRQIKKRKGKHGQDDAG